MTPRDQYAAIQRRFAQAFGWTPTQFNDAARKRLRGAASPAAWVQPRLR